MLEINYVNNVGVVAKNPKMTAINSAIEVDLTGQVCADSIGTRMYSGFGGQVDFIRGAAEGFDGKGKPIIALPSVTNKGQSKIVPTLKLGKIRKHTIHCFENPFLLIDSFHHRRRSRYIQSPCALRSHRIRHRLSLRKNVTPACVRADPDRSPGSPRSAREGCIWTAEDNAISQLSMLSTNVDDIRSKRAFTLFLR